MAAAYKDLYCSAIGSLIQSIAEPLLAIATRRLTSVRWHTDGAPYRWVFCIDVHWVHSSTASTGPSLEIARAGRPLHP
jgi:hypothetical protein